jgi:hypothetical protein
MKPRKKIESDDANKVIDKELLEEVIKIEFEKLSSERMKLPKKPEAIASTGYNFHLKLIKVSRCTLVIVFAFSIYSFFGLFLAMPGELIMSILTIIVALAAEILVLLEVLKGAGKGIETEYSQGEIRFAFRTFNFIPSINSLTKLLFFIGSGFISIIIGFSGIYLELCRQGLNNFTGKLSGISAVYFSLLSFATVGFADILPSSILAKAAVSAEIFTSLFSTTVILAATISWVVTDARQRQEEFMKKHENTVKQREEFLRQAGLGTIEDLDNIMNEAKKRIAQKNKIS